MRPRLLPSLVNGRSGDPALYVDFLLEKRAMLFDLGDLSALPARKLLRLTDIFVSHCHVDHFIGFDQLLRVILGRDVCLRLHGPAGFADRVEAKLDAYVWNLADRIRADLVLDVTEVLAPGEGRRACFRLKDRFSRADLGPVALPGGVLRDEPSLRVICAILDHGMPCLGFALEETAHVNVWRNQLAEAGLAVGPWLTELKAAILAGMPEATPIAVTWRDDRPPGAPTLPLGKLRDAITTVTAGQKIGYITDVAYIAANVRSILDLIRSADTLFIEAAFAQADAADAAARNHLTTVQAGTLGRDAGVGRIEPFHFSSRYAGEEERLTQEVGRAFRGVDP